MSGFYDNSPGMVDDITPKAEAEAPAAMLGGEAKPGNANQAPASAPASAPQADQATETRSPLAADALTGAERSPFAADVCPYGSSVATTVQQAAESKGRPPEEAKALAAEWAQSFAHFGVPETHIANLVGAGLQVADKAPDEATLKTWGEQAKERLAGTYGGAEGGARALATAQAWVRAHPKLAGFLNRTGLGSHPQVVAAIAATADQARKDGRFK